MSFQGTILPQHRRTTGIVSGQYHGNSNTTGYRDTHHDVTVSDPNHRDGVEATKKKVEDVVYCKVGLGEIGAIMYDLYFDYWNDAYVVFMLACMQWWNFN
jgi:hypothetical protein